MEGASEGREVMGMLNKDNLISKTELLTDDSVNELHVVFLHTWATGRQNDGLLRPVGDVAEHEAASVIRQPADHEGYDHRS